MTRRPQSGTGAPLFDHASDDRHASQDAASGPEAALSDERLVDAIRTGDERFDATHLLSELRRRGLAAPLPALVHLWNRLVPFGEKRLHPIQTEILAILEQLDDPAAGRILTEFLKRPGLAGALLARTLQAAVLRKLRIDTDTLCPWCEHPDPQVRRAAFRLAALTARADSRLVRQLEAGLEDHDRDVRRAARIAMAHQNNEVVRAALLQDLQARPDHAVIRALGVIADDDVVVRLGRLAKGNPSFRDVVIDVLETVGGDRASRVLARLTGDGGPSAGPAAGGK